MADENHANRIADELGIKVKQVAAAAELLEDGCTVPFIARYRKEATGSLDEVHITTIRDRLEQLVELDKRREAILKSLEERELLTEDLGKAIMAADSMAELEDIYLPYRPKRRTRATIAREKGLEPLAESFTRRDHLIRQARLGASSIRKREWSQWKMPSQGPATSSRKKLTKTRQFVRPHVGCFLKKRRYAPR